jgi:predicted small metal-binding protein
MKKRLSCRAMGINCEFEVHDESEEEITSVLASHAKRVHGIDFTDALRQRARDLIRLETG